MPATLEYPSAGRAHATENSDRLRHVSRPSRTEIEQVNATERTLCRVGYQDLTAASFRIHLRRPVQHVPK
jgi:hypothetical protein